MLIEVYTDGACIHSGEAGGYAAALYVDGTLIDATYGGMQGTTNNQMELMGIIAGLKLIPLVPRIACKNCGVTSFVPTGGVVGEPTFKTTDLYGCDVAEWSPHPCMSYSKWVTQVPLYSDPLIISDSQYCIKGATSWLEMWKTNGWKTKAKQPVKNQDLWQEIDWLKKSRQPQFGWVKGHSGVAGNEKADQLASAAAQLSYYGSSLPWEEKVLC